MISILIVSRQLLIMEFSIIVLLYLIDNHKKQLSMIIKGLCLVFIVWIILGSFRNQNDSYLKNALEIQNNPPISIRDMNLYMYVAYNYDNLNANVVYNNNRSYGYNILFPLFALTGTKNLFGKYMSVEPVKPIKVFNTFPIQYFAYIDFGIIGVIIYMFIIGLFSSSIKRKAESKRDICVINYSLVLYALLFSFFTSFFANPSFVFNMIYINVLYKIKGGR